MEAGGKGNGFQVIGNVEGRDVSGAVKVIVGTGNRRSVGNHFGLPENEVGVEIGIVVGTAITCPETGVDVEIHEVGEASHVASATGLAAGKIRERREIDRIGADGLKERVDEGEVALLVIRVVMDVLRHVTVENLQGRHVKRAAAVYAGFFPILCPAEFGVLLPEIAFENFGCGEESQNGDVALGDGRALALLSESREALGEYSRSHSGGGSGDHGALQERATVGMAGCSRRRS